MTSVLQHDLGPPSKANIKTEDSSAHTNTAVNTDAVTEHEHAQDLPETSRFPEQSTGHYQNIQCKQETTGHWYGTAGNSRNVDIACTCNCNDTADIHDIKEGVTVDAEYGILGTGVSFPGEFKLIKDRCEFTVCVHKSLFSRGVIDRLGIEEIKNNVDEFIHNTNTNMDDISRHNRTDDSQITKDDCDTPESKAVGNVQNQDKQYTCIKCGEECFCKFSVTQHISACSEFKPYLCEKCTASSHTSDCRRQKNLETITDSGEGTEQNTAVNSPMVKHTTQKTHLCDVCGNVFTNKRRFEKHKQIHTGQETYTCTDCGRSFRRKSAFYRHRKTHIKVNTFKCTECGKAFFSKSNLYKHRRTHTGSKAYKYTNCEQTLNQQSNANSHNTSTQQNDCHQALHTSDETISNKKLTQYNFEKRKISKDESRDRCKITAQGHNLVYNDNFIPDDLGEVKDADCDTTQSKQTASEGDVNVCTKKKSHLCENCGKTFDTKSNLQKHMLVHTEERPYKCSHCDKTFKHSRNLKVHMQIHTGERPYKCLQCGKIYTKNENLKIHMRGHTGERPYKCTYCHKSFTSKPTLTCHIRTHTGEKPHKCIYCNKTFTQKTTLAFHIRTHTGEKTHKCTYCDKTFAHTGHLADHIRTHTGEKPHKCTYCDMKFTQKSHLTYHIRTHTGEKPHTCTFCGKKFTRKETLRKHTLLHTKH